MTEQCRQTVGGAELGIDKRWQCGYQKKKNAAFHFVVFITAKILKFSQIISKSTKVLRYFDFVFISYLMFLLFFQKNAHLCNIIT